MHHVNPSVTDPSVTDLVDANPSETAGLQPQNPPASDAAAGVEAVSPVTVTPESGTADPASPARPRPVHLTHPTGTLEFDVRPTELDSFGHVNNARYLEYLEWARAEWGNVRGLSYARFRAEGLIPAVVEARLRFLHEATLGDRLRIETRPEVKHAARIVFHQEIFNQHGKRVLRAEVSVVAVDLAHRTFTEFPEIFLAAAQQASQTSRT